MEFSDRLNLVMNYYGMNASSFADRVQVGRSSISHLLSGRNKPSLEFVMNVLKEFEAVELNWLVDGKGDFPSTGILAPIIQSPELFKEEDSLPEESATLEKEQLITEKVDKDKNVRIESDDVIPKVNNNIKGKYITRVITLYSDGSFEDYYSNNE